MKFLPSCDCISITEQMHHMDTNKTRREKPRWELHKNTLCCFKQTLAATPPQNISNTEWNDKIVAIEKTTWFYFRLMKTGFLFFVVDHLRVGQLCTNPKSDRSLLSCLKVTQCSTSEIRDAPLYNSCLYRSKLWQ